MKTLLATLWITAALAGAALASTAVRFSEVCQAGTADSTAMEQKFKGETTTVTVKNAAIVTESDIQSAKPFSDENGFGVMLTLTPEGAKKLNEGIKDMLHKPLAIIVNERLVSAPVLQVTNFGNSLQIVGNMSEAETIQIAKDLSK